MKRILSAIFVLISYASSFAQTITGTVKDKNDQSPLVGVNVLYSNSGTSTDLDGNFKINSEEELETIIFKFIGYVDVVKKVNLKKDQTLSLDIEMIETATQLNTVVVSAGKFEQKIEETTVSIEVIKSSLIENKNTTNIQTAIDQIPGVNITDGQANIRGGSGWSYGAGTRVQVLVDDMPLISGDAGQAQWSLISTENINQVEVIKGASSSLYGSSALNGVINIRTAYPGSTPETKINYHYGLYDSPKRESLKWWGDNQQTISGMDFLHKQKIKNLDLVVGGFLLKDKGYRYKEETSRSRFNFNTKYKNQKIEGLAYGINGNFLKNETATALIWQNYETAYIPLDSSVTVTSGDVYNIDPYISYINPKNNDSHHLRGRYMHVINDNETKDNDSGQDNKSETYYGEYQFQKKIEPIKLNWTSGIVFEYVNAKSELFQGNNFRENTALFTQLDKKLGQRINLSAGARYERFKLSTGQEYIIDGTKINEIIDSKPVFRSGINYQLAKATYLRSSFGQGYRFPSIAELFIKTEVASGIWVFENPALKPEHGWSSEIAVKQGYKIGKWKGYADLALFIMEYQDMMEFTFSQWDDQEEGVIPGLGFKSINIGETRISGTEFTIVGTGKIRDVEINFLGGYTYIKPISLEPNKILNNDESLNYISSSSDTSNLILKYRYEHLAKIDVEIKHQKSSLGVSLRYNSFMQNIDGFFVNPFFAGLVPGIVESRESLNKGDFLMDIRLQQFFNNGANISLIINNALNTEYQTRPANLMAPRMISLKWGFKI